MQRTERWLELCKKAAVESNPKKMLTLVKEINDLLEARYRRRQEVTMSEPVETVKVERDYFAD